MKVKDLKRGDKIIIDGVEERISSSYTIDGKTHLFFEPKPVLNTKKAENEPTK